MRQPLNLSHLDYFLTIAEKGSVKEACQLIGISQPALSAQLSQLEEALCVKVFDRSGRSLKLNSNGKRLQGLGNQLFRIVGEIHDISRTRASSEKLNLHIGTLLSFSRTLLHEFIMPFWKDKKITVKVFENSLKELFEDLKHDRVDAIVVDKNTMSNGYHFESHKLSERKIVLVGSYKKFEKLKKIKITDLNHYPILRLTRHSQLQVNVDQYLNDHGILPNIVGEADDANLLRIAAENGVGLVILPYSTVKESIRSKKLKILHEIKDIRSDAWVLVKKGNPHRVRITHAVEHYGNDHS